MEGPPFVAVEALADVLAAPGVPFCAVKEDQGRHSISARANSPAAMPIATRADLKIVWLRFSSRIAAAA
ncbi:MAG: hypothetical protein U0361_05140 [Nitrospiraceae bacterium]